MAHRKPKQCSVTKLRGKALFEAFWVAGVKRRLQKRGVFEVIRSGLNAENTRVKSICTRNMKPLL